MPRPLALTFVQDLTNGDPLPGHKQVFERLQAPQTPPHVAGDGEAAARVPGAAVEVCDGELGGGRGRGRGRVCGDGHAAVGDLDGRVSPQLLGELDLRVGRGDHICHSEGIRAGEGREGEGRNEKES